MTATATKTTKFVATRKAMGFASYDERGFDTRTDAVDYLISEYELGEIQQADLASGRSAYTHAFCYYVEVK